PRLLAFERDVESPHSASNAPGPAHDRRKPLRKRIHQPIEVHRDILDDRVVSGSTRKDHYIRTVSQLRRTCKCESKGRTLAPPACRVRQHGAKGNSSQRVDGRDRCKKNSPAVLRFGASWAVCGTKTARIGDSQINVAA